MIKALIKYKYLSFVRFKMSPFLAPPDFLAILLSFLFLSAITIGLSLENPIDLLDDKIINFNYIICLNYFIILFFESYIVNYTTPNYKYIKILLPLNINKIIIVDVLTEVFSYKILSLCFLGISYLIFLNYYEVTAMSGINLIGVLLVLLSYINSCLLIVIIKNKKSNYLDQNKNIIKLFFFILIIVSVINYNIKLVNFDAIDTTYGLGILIIILNIIFVNYIYFVNVRYDRI